MENRVRRIFPLTGAPRPMLLCRRSYGAHPYAKRLASRSRGFGALQGHNVTRRTSGVSFSGA